MQKHPAKPISLRELAEQILALPADQQQQPAYYHAIDDGGYERHQPVFGIEIDAKNGVSLEGIDEN